MLTFITKNVVKNSGNLVTIIKILNDNQQQVGDAEWTLDNPDTAKLNDIYIYRIYRGNHYGNALLTEVCEKAKRQGATILRCHPSPYERGYDELRDKEPLPSYTPEAKLTAWYITQGFKELDLKLEQDLTEFGQHFCRLYKFLGIIVPTSP